MSPSGQPFPPIGLGYTHHAHQTPHIPLTNHRRMSRAGSLYSTLLLKLCHIDNFLFHDISCIPRGRNR